MIFVDTIAPMNIESKRIMIKLKTLKESICKNVFPCLFSFYDISFLRHEQICLMRLRSERYFSREVSLNVASLNIFFHDV